MNDYNFKLPLKYQPKNKKYVLRLYQHN